MFKLGLTRKKSVDFSRPTSLNSVARHTIKSAGIFTSLSAVLVLSACGGNQGGNTSSSASESSSSAVSSSSSSSSSVSSVQSSSSSSERPSGPPVNVGPPNAANQTPAFPEQTRAPEVISYSDINAQTIASGLSSPWGLEFLPDGRLLVTEKTGSLRIVDTNGNISSPISGVPAVYSSGQGGLLDVNISPYFDQDRMVYMSFSESRSGGNGTSVVRGRLSNDNTRLENTQIIFRQTPAWNSTLHFGSRLVWDEEGFLYVTLGERSYPEPRTQAQDPHSLLGKVVRIAADGGIPASNPFADGLMGSPEVWSYGHRNVQGASLHPETGELWTIEHGPRGGDEINRPEPGKNYGWPIITYGIDYNGSPIGQGITAQAGLEQPIYYWDPVIAPAGMTFYSGDMFPEWNNNLLIGGLGVQQIVRVMLDGDTVIGEERLASGYGRVRDVIVAEDGAVWFATDQGQIIRLSR